jgi:hypothetical protein
VTGDRGERQIDGLYRISIRHFHSHYANMLFGEKLHALDLQPNFGPLWWLIRTAAAIPFCTSTENRRTACSTTHQRRYVGGVRQG